MKKSKGPRDYRNPVAEAAAYLTKPARHRDRKHDYQRSEKHRGRASANQTADEASAKRKREVLARESEDWLADLNEGWYLRDQHELGDEDSSATGEV